MHKKIAKVDWTFGPILNKPLKNAHRLFKIFHGGKISPNLVTLPSSFCSDLSSFLACSYLLDCAFKQMWKSWEFFPNVSVQIKTFFVFVCVWHKFNWLKNIQMQREEATTSDWKLLCYLNLKAQLKPFWLLLGVTSQCEQMARLFLQFLAFYENKPLPNN